MNDNSNNLKKKENNNTKRSSNIQTLECAPKQELLVSYPESELSYQAVS